MARQEARTDFWVGKLLEDEGIPYTPQGTDNDEIAQALKSASKRGTGNAGFPEFVSVIKDYVLVIEDKADTSKHMLLTKDDVLDDSTKAVSDYAVNGAIFYGKHIAQNTNFKKVFAIGVSGDDKNHEITPLYCDDRDGYKQLENIDTFANFSEKTSMNIIRTTF